MAMATNKALHSPPHASEQYLLNLSTEEGTEQ